MKPIENGSSGIDIYKDRRFESDLPPPIPPRYPDMLENRSLSPSPSPSPSPPPPPQSQPPPPPQTLPPGMTITNNKLVIHQFNKDTCILCDQYYNKCTSNTIAS